MYSIFSVTTPATDTSLLTIAELRAATGVTDNDTALYALGRGVSATISRQCGLAADGINPPTLLSETCSDVIRLHRPTETLMLSRRPVTEITTVTVNDEVLDDDEYEVNPATGLLTRLSDDCPICWPCGKIEVEYIAGLLAITDDLKLAASKLATSFSAENARDPSLRRVDIPGVIEKEYWVGPSDDPLLTNEIAQLLAPYRQYRL